MENSAKIFFIGPERTGTTWIHNYLLSRGDISLPIGTKETFFFDHYYHKGIKWYNKHFDYGKPLTVEVAPTYFKSDKLPNRIKKHFPRAKIIVTLRNPLERSISHFNHLLRYGLWKRHFAEAIIAKPEIIDASLYFKHYLSWLDAFGPENIFCIFYDKLRSDQGMFVHEICKILQIDYLPVPESLKGKRANPLTSPRSIFLASAGNVVKNFFRRHRLYGVVEAAKRVGLKNIFFGKETKELELPELSDMEILVEIFTKELIQLNEFVKLDSDIWIDEMNEMKKKSKQ